MSLNGLNDTEVKEAYEAAVAEAGGWYVMALSRVVWASFALAPSATG